MIDSDNDFDGDGWCAGDCDDTDPTLHPGQWEDPNDGIDLDCSGTDATHVEHLEAQLTGAEAGHGVGVVEWVPDFTGDGLAEMAVGAGAADVTALSGAGKVYVVTSEQLAGLPSFSLADAHAVIWGASPSGGFGRSLLGLDDYDGDGLGDLVVGEWTRDEFLDGAAYVFGGAALAAGGVFGRADADHFLAGSANYERFAETMVSVGDLDGDGLSDFAIGARWAYSPYYRSGSVYLVTSGDLASSSGEFDPEQSFAIIRGVTREGAFGADLAGGFDFEVDGVADLVVGASGIPDPVEGVGMIYGFLGGILQSGGEFTAADAFFTIAPTWDSDLGGVASAGDLDGDGRQDLALTIPAFQAYPNASPGGLLVFTSDQLAPGPDLEEADRWAQLTGGEGGDGTFGSHVTSGDLDGDGDVELVVSDPQSDDGTPTLGSFGAGKVWIYDGSEFGSGAVLTTAFASAGLEGFEASYGLGGSPLSTADVDGDGSLELIVTAAGDDEGGANAGKVYVLSPEL